MFPEAPGDLSRGPCGGHLSTEESDDVFFYGEIKGSDVAMEESSHQKGRYSP